MWHAGWVIEPTPDAGPGLGAGPPAPAAADRIEWLALPDVAERLGVPLAVVRRLVEDRELIASRRGERSVLRIPAAFLVGDRPHPALKGTFTVLADGGMDDDEIIDWLFAPDETLPVPGAAIDSLRAGFRTEVRRRAMEAAL